MTGRELPGHKYMPRHTENGASIPPRRIFLRPTTGVGIGRFCRRVPGHGISGPRITAQPSPPPEPKAQVMPPPPPAGERGAFLSERGGR